MLREDAEASRSELQILAQISGSLFPLTKEVREEITLEALSRTPPLGITPSSQ